jgi:hypothetical protein
MTHHGAVEELRETGADVVDARVVDDGDVLTAGGITTGIDLALWLASASGATKSPARSRTPWSTNGARTVPGGRLIRTAVCYSSRQAATTRSSFSPRTSSANSGTRRTS